MDRRPGKSAGIAIFIACIAGFIIYAWFLLASEWSEAVLKLTVLAAVAGLLGVLAWIGITMATAPPPPSADQEQFGSRRLEPEEPQN